MREWRLTSGNLASPISFLPVHRSVGISLEVFSGGVEVTGATGDRGAEGGRGAAVAGATVDLVHGGVVGDSTLVISDGNEPSISSVPVSSMVFMSLTLACSSLVGSRVSGAVFAVMGEGWALFKSGASLSWGEGASWLEGTSWGSTA